MNWRKIARETVIVIGTLGSIAAVVNVFVTPADVQHFLKSISARTSIAEVLSAVTLVMGVLLMVTMAARVYVTHKLVIQLTKMRRPWGWSII